MEKDADIIVLGGGASGLAAAYLAARAGLKVILVEASATVGGLLSTFPVGGTRLEHYYHHFFSHDEELRWLCAELGIADRLRFHAATMGVYRGGNHFAFNSPADLLLRFKPVDLPGRLRFAATSLYLGRYADWRNWEHMTALEWFRRYAGKSATDAIWQPMLEIKFGPYASEVPVSWMIGRLRQRMNSRERGDERLGYLEGSLEVLLSALTQHLKRLGVVVKTNLPVEGLVVDQGVAHAIKTAEGTLTSHQLLSSLPTPHLARLLAPHHAEYANDLAKVQYFGAVCTILEMNQPLSETYWLNVADEGFPFGGVIEHTNLIHPGQYQGRHLAYLSRYYEAGHPLSKAPTAEVGETMLRPLSRLYPDWQESRLENVHVFRTNTAAVVCDRGFSKKVPAVSTPLRDLYAISMAHVYPDERSCNNSIRVAGAALRSMGHSTGDLPRGPSLAGLIGFS
ncbi:MAG TPA: FAD-dependent oxidoreductase [Verrucomicrobium sp.]|nr:FAD-dependent oxidoreductase [Verrucomicrobium sp.]